MHPKIHDFIGQRIEELQRAGLPVRRLSDDVLASEGMKFRKAYGWELPSVYVDVCRRLDGITDANGICLHGVETVWRRGESYPDYEGLMELQERLEIDIGPVSLIEFGNRGGVEPWGWHAEAGCFVRGDPNYRDIMARFNTFEDMFRGLFGIDESPML